MEGKIIQKHKTRKILSLLVVVVFLGLGLHWYVRNEDFLKNQKISYIPNLYAPLFFREISQFNPFLAASGASLKQEDVQEVREGRDAAAVPVLVYHGVVTKAQQSNSLLADFRKQMFALKDAGWETVSLGEFGRFLQGEAQLPEKSFLLTFDDGRKDSYYPVDPILRALDYQAVMFVITNQSLGEKGEASHFYLSPEELRRMGQTGRWDIQSHGKFAHEMHPIGPNGEEGHFYSNLLWVGEEQRRETVTEFQERIYEDLKTSKQELQEYLGSPVFAFAFPFGDYGQNLFVDSNFELAKDVLLLGAKEHYDFAFYQWWEGEGFTYNYWRPGAFLLKRLEPDAAWSGKELVAALEQGKPKSLPFQDTFSSNTGWLSTWGSYDILKESDELVFRASQHEAGASAILDGSGAWQDYQVSAVVESPTQTGVFLWVRFQDGNNNAACNFGKDFVHVEQVLEGQHRVIQGIRDVTPIPQGEFTVQARVQGRTVQCLINDQVLVETPFLDISLDHGGIGFKMWDDEVGRASLHIKKLEVQLL